MRLLPGEVERIAAHVGLAVESFIQEHTRLAIQRDGLALLDQADGACAWLQDGQCRIHDVKPQQCRDFPNLWSFPGADKICRARPVEVSVNEWKQRIFAATGRSVDAPGASIVGPL